MTFREVLKQKEITQVKLAKELGVTQALISKWVNGELTPRTKMLPKISKILNVTVDNVISYFAK